jgi:hypothetical protein
VDYGGADRRAECLAVDRDGDGAVKTEIRGQASAVCGLVDLE